MLTCLVRNARRIQSREALLRLVWGYDVPVDSTWSTVETVRFSRPERFDFRLVRGPVPYVVKSFVLDSRDGGTILTHAGELGTDLWNWASAGATSSARWEATVQASLDSAKREAERQSRP